MQRFIALICLGLSFSYSQAQRPPSDLLPQYAQEATEKQYHSAYQRLSQEFAEDSTSLLLKQAEHLLRYFSKTVAHQYFGLHDFQSAEQDLVKLRQEGVYDGDLYYFPVDSLLLPILHKAPADEAAKRQRAKAHFLIAWYYYQVESYFPHHWIMPEAQVRGLMYRHFQQYLNYAETEDWQAQADFLEKAYDGLGYYELHQENYQAAQKHFYKRLKVSEQASTRPEAPSVYYNLAYCFLKLEEPQRGIEMANRALLQYEAGIREADTHRLLALLNAEAKKWEKAEEHWLAWGKQTQNTFESWMQLLDMYLNEAQLEEAENWADKIWKEDSIAPRTYETLIDHYGEAEQLPAFIDFLQAKTSRYEGNAEVIGALYFFSADAAMILRDKEAAKTYLLKAKEAFAQLYDKQKAQRLQAIIDQVLKKL